MLSYFTRATRGMADAELQEVQPGEDLPLAPDSIVGEEESKVPEAEPEPIGSALYDRERVLELGDRVLIEYDEDKTVWGQVYYRSNTLLRLRPDMPGNTLIDFPRDYNVDDRIDKFQDDLRVTRSFILKKRREDHPDFVRQQDFQIGQTLVGVLPEGDKDPPIQLKISASRKKTGLQLSIMRLRKKRSWTLDSVEFQWNRRSRF